MTARGQRARPIRVTHVVAVMRHPGLWTTAVRQIVRLAPRGWWKTWPFLPLPDRAYLEFRLVTQYGDAAHDADASDVLNYLRWCNQWERSTAR